MVTTGAITHAKLQSNQQTNTQHYCLQAGCPSCHPTNSVSAAIKLIKNSNEKWKRSVLCTCAFCYNTASQAIGWGYRPRNNIYWVSIRMLNLRTNQWPCCPGLGLGLWGNCIGLSLSLKPWCLSIGLLTRRLAPRSQHCVLPRLSSNTCTCW